MYRLAMHVYPAHLTDCPWCTLDNQGVIYFIDLGEEVITTGGDFVLAKVWAMVMASVAPPALQLPLPDHFQPTGRPLPLGLLRREYIILLRSHCQRYRCCFAAFRQNRVILFWFLCWRLSGLLAV